MSKITGFTNAVEQPSAGEVIYSPGTTPPSGYLTCNGAVVSQATYPSLYSVLGLYTNGPDNFTQLNSNSRGAFSLISGLAYGNGKYVYAGNAGGYSTDGVTWTSLGTSGTPYYYIVASSSLFVRAGGQLSPNAIQTSTDAITWTTRTGGSTTYYIRSLATNGSNLYVYGGDNGTLGTSTDGITWTARTTGTTSAIYALVYNGSNLYVFAGAGGSLRTSTNAITWTSRTSGTVSQINALTYGNSLYVYGGDGGIIATSTNAITWTARTSGITSGISSLTYGNGLYMYIAGYYVGTSTDAVTWTVRSAIAGATTCAYLGTNYYVAGYTGLLAYAPKYTYNTASDFSLPNPLNPVSGAIFAIKT